MDEWNEITWKAHFIAHLAELFVRNGLNKQDALADAHAHSHDSYLSREDADPESAAEALHHALSGDADLETVQ